MQLHQARGVGTYSEPGAVAERHQPSVADAKIEPRRRDRERHDHGPGIQRQAERPQGERQRDGSQSREQQRTIFGG